MKVGILTTFSNWSETYSLVHIVEAQIRMLKKAGHEVVLFLNEDFYGSSPDCETRKIVPVFTYEHYQTVLAVPSHLVTHIKERLQENMKDIDVCLTHDILLQDSFLPHNLAIRMINLPIIWRHWIHSQPNNIKVANLPENHKLVFLNYSDQLPVAERFNAWMDEVGVVYNTVEPHSFVGDEMTKAVSKVFENKDVKIAYAFCTTRMGSKGVDKLLKLAGKIKANGKSVGICLANSNANAEKEKYSIKIMTEQALRYGLSKEDFLFTSTLGKEYEGGLPNKVTRDLFHLSNLFIFPTVSECCSLVLLEAMSGKNLLVLNGDIDSMKEFGGHGSALYMKFGSIFHNTAYSDENMYYNDWAKIIIRQLNSDMAQKSKDRADKYFSEDYIWETQLSKLI